MRLGQRDKSYNFDRDPSGVRSVAGSVVSGSLGLRPFGRANIIEPRADRGASLSICTVRISALHSFRLLALPQTDFSPDHPVGMRCLADFSVGA